MQRNMQSSKAFRWWTATIVVVALVGLWVTSPSRLMPECQGSSVPRHCVD